MNTEEFTTVIEEQIERSLSVLVEKVEEYAADGDRLHNFKQAAHLQGMTPREALAGMMAKHTVSIYDMCHSGLVYPDHVINEKITDHINYLLLLRALFEDESRERSLADRQALRELREKLIGDPEPIHNNEEE